MLLRIWSLAVKESIQLMRDRLMAAFIFLFPVAQLVLLAQVAGQGITNLPVAVLDYDRSAASRGLAQALENQPDLVWRYQLSSPAELDERLARGEAAVAVVIPARFGAEIAAVRSGGPAPAVQILIDGSNSVVGNSARLAAEGAITDYVTRQVTAGIQASAPIEVRSQVLFNPALNTRLFTIPAQMGFIIYQVTLAVASLAFARERELGTLEQLLVTPLRRLELIIGKASLAWVVGLLDFLLMYVVVVTLYDIPMRGSFLLLLAASMLFIAVEIGFGVIVSSYSRTQQQAILYVFMLAMLDVALSGYLVPVKNMPAALQTLATLSPMQHYLVIIRAIMLKGAGLAMLWPQIAAIGAIGVGVAVVATITSTRNLE